nr:hypothetical protein [uncultured Desulfobacter sp.]
MQTKDIYFAVFLVLFFVPFAFLEPVQNLYAAMIFRHALIMSFLKFAFLATMGEVIGLRILKGVYFKKGFGLLPRALFWGITGVMIKIAFTIFAIGSTAVFDHYIYPLPESVLAGPFSMLKLAAAFTISVCINLIFSPIFMTFHKISDIHIEETGGTITGYFSEIDMEKVLKSIDWSVMWGFVFKKTLPFFWIPAHTITFLLPPDSQMLFAAILGIVLGIILAMAGLSKKTTEQPGPTC